MGKDERIYQSKERDKDNKLTSLYIYEKEVY